MPRISREHAHALVSGDQKQDLHEQLGRAIGIAAARGSGAVPIGQVENELWALMLGLGRALMSHYLSAHAASRGCAGPMRRRSINTLFGWVEYERPYERPLSANGSGFHPTDVEIGLSADRASPVLLNLGARLATRMSFSAAQEVLRWLVPTAPSTEVIEQTVLGLAHHTQSWFESAPTPPDDGDVLVISIDSKGVPTATDAELALRRGPRREKVQAPSQRHRGRSLRQERGPKPRRKKGDKSKNAKMATLVLMYTLRRDGPLLLGPLNRRVYASFAHKEHAFEIARREAERRGFGVKSGRTVQLVTDGENCWTSLAKKHLPHAMHTLDVVHVLEKLWSAGETIFAEGTPACARWVSRQRKRLYAGRIHLVLRELRARLDATPKTGPGNKGKRTRLELVLNYLTKRTDQMRYDEWVAQDLEVASGPVEGAIKYLIARRFDQGGMRWTQQRAEALLQLRCIEANGHWDLFTRFVGERERDQSLLSRSPRLLKTRLPPPLAMAKRAD